MVEPFPSYRGRLAPSPTGRLHLGHARTFWVAQQRARAAAGALLLRNDDLDKARCRPEFVTAMREDMAWFGLNWEEPMVSQSERIPLYRAALARLHAAGSIYPCNQSRRDVEQAATAPHEAVGPVSDRSKARRSEPGRTFADEPIYPPQFRPPVDAPLPPLTEPIAINWRFRVPDGVELAFEDRCLGRQSAMTGREFGDFLVWRKDDLPSYQLACVVDDAAMGITEVVRGADLVRSTFRQLLLFRALGLAEPAFFHCPLMTDNQGVRLAKRHDSLALSTLREEGCAPDQISMAWHQ